MFKNIFPILIICGLLIVNNIPNGQAKEIDTAKWDNLYVQSLEDYDNAHEKYTDVSEAFPDGKPDENVEPKPQGESTLGESSDIKAFAELTERKNRLVLITGLGWCRPCNDFDSRVIKKLEARNEGDGHDWIINSTNLAHVQQFVVENNGIPPYEATKYNVHSFPTLIVIQDGKEVKRYTGLQQFNQYDMPELINGTYDSKKKEDKQ